eukprot:Seg663.5 transcript_id=Seg663.5/GoldUCD/mRNA.D3Y31 product="hypothetical protein" protein_id=Seg663.5/GoldUCD/D3Y31
MSSLKPAIEKSLKDIVDQGAGGEYANHYMEQKYIVEQKKMVDLFSHGCLKEGCNGKSEVTSLRSIGGVLEICWKCVSGHSGKWESSSVIGEKEGQKMFAVPLQLAASILFSGNNYEKVALIAEFLHLDILSERSFHRFQTHYLIPSIQWLFDELCTNMKSALSDHELCVCGDGRNDSPGHCAKYCTYVCMHQSLEIILEMEVVDKRETGGNSAVMEITGLKRIMERMRGKLNVTEIVTDASPSIKKLVKDLKGRAATQ